LAAKVALLPSRRCWRLADPSSGIGRALRPHERKGIADRIAGEGPSAAGVHAKRLTTSASQQGLAPGPAALLRANRPFSMAELSLSAELWHNQPAQAPQPARQRRPAEEGQPYDPAHTFRRMTPATTFAPVPTIDSMPGLERRRISSLSNRQGFAFGHQAESVHSAALSARPFAPGKTVASRAREIDASADLPWNAEDLRVH